MSSEQFSLFQFRGSFSYASSLPSAEVRKKSDEVEEFLTEYIDLEAPLTRVSRRNDFTELSSEPEGYFQSYVAFKKVNNIVGINKFLKSINEKLPVGGMLAICAETMETRRKRVFNGYPSLTLYPYYLSDFLFNRVLPKLKLTKKIYFKLNKHSNRVLSLPEILGRLVFAGFRIVNIKQINNLTYFIVEKERGPVSNTSPAYGMFFKMKRVGKDGKIIHVHKIRTMYPYSEYIQQFVYETCSLSKGGKFKDDFRITGWGRILRKYWLDEIPMILNWFKGDMKVVGLRPLSEHYLSLYNKNLAVNRFTIKPGLIPPFYKDLPGTLDEIMKSEEKYLELYRSHPVKTDISYLFKALQNIFLKGARSA